ncbi:MAG: hypothetical protein JW860_10490 [Sedimentisphaerales bacterium]|nr:hypothetical protein [Sedimentisphaerales bacterium]
MVENDWPFSDPQNIAVITCKEIVSGVKWIYYVTHDADDGAWQFHPKYPSLISQNEAIIVGLKEIVSIDPTIKDLADLPLGWHAWRASKDAQWERAPIS